MTKSILTLLVGIGISAASFAQQDTGKTIRKMDRQKVEQWRNATPGQKAELRAKLKKATPEQKMEMKAKAKMKFEDLTPEQKTKVKANAKAAYRKLSPEEKAKMKETLKAKKAPQAATP